MSLFKRQQSRDEPSKPRERSWEEYGYYEVPGPGGGPSRAAWDAQWESLDRGFTRVLLTGGATAICPTGDVPLEVLEAACERAVKEWREQRQDAGVADA